MAPSTLSTAFTSSRLLPPPRTHAGACVHVQAMLWVGVFTREQHVRLEALHEVAMMWSALDVSLLAGLLVMSEIKHLSMCVPSTPICLARHPERGVGSHGRWERPLPANHLQPLVPTPPQAAACAKLTTAGLSNAGACSSARKSIW